MFKLGVNFIVLILTITTFNVLAAVSDGLIEVNDRQLFFEADIVDENQATLVLLPGINRGLSTRTKDSLLAELSKNKINWVTFHFSTHPESVIQSKTLSKDTSRIKLSELRDEVKAVLDKLNLKKPFVVSLSYSSAATSVLRSSDLNFMIETAPMGRPDESDSSMAPIVSTNNFYCSNPFMVFTPYCMSWEIQKNNAYQAYWGARLKSLINIYPELNQSQYYQKALEGYVGMAKAVESYDYSNVEFTKGPERVFILGENEESSRLKIQLNAIKNYQTQKGEYARVIVVKGAGHIIPTEQPGSYLKLLSDIINSKLPKNSVYNFIDEKGNYQPLSAKDLFSL